MISMADKNDIEKRLIRLLQHDSRQSYRDLAKQLGISHVSVSSKVNTLEDDGVIRGYTTIVDPDKLNHYLLCMMISADAGADLSQIGNKIADLKEINVVMRVSGACELLVLAVCDNRKSALKLLDTLSAIKGIEKVESHIVLEAIKLGGVKVRD